MKEVVNARPDLQPGKDYGWVPHLPLVSSGTPRERVEAWPTLIAWDSKFAREYEDAERRAYRGALSRWEEGKTTSLIPRLMKMLDVKHKGAWRYGRLRYMGIPVEGSLRRPN